MLRFTNGFLVLALLVAFLGFGGVTSQTWEGWEIFFFIFLGLAMVSLLGGKFKKRHRPFGR